MEDLKHMHKACSLHELQLTLAFCEPSLPLPPASLSSSWILHCFPLSSSLTMNQLLPAQFHLMRASFKVTVRSDVGPGPDETQWHVLAGKETTSPAS